MKVVVNRCYGGFSLSAKAVKRLAELQGRKAYIYKTDPKHYGRVVRLSVKELRTDKGGFFTAYDLPTADEVNTLLFVQDKWDTMTAEERQASNELIDKHVIETRPHDRTDPLLVQVVEELGDEASGYLSELKIVEIPDDIEWSIDDYDGMERVEEAHRSW